MFMISATMMIGSLLGFGALAAAVLSAERLLYRGTRIRDVLWAAAAIYMVLILVVSRIVSDYLA